METVVSRCGHQLPASRGTAPSRRAFAAPSRRRSQGLVSRRQQGAGPSERTRARCFQRGDDADDDRARLERLFGREEGGSEPYASSEADCFISRMEGPDSPLPDLPILETPQLRVPGLQETLQLSTPQEVRMLEALLEQQGPWYFGHVCSAGGDGGGDGPVPAVLMEVQGVHRPGEGRLEVTTRSVCRIEVLHPLPGGVSPRAACRLWPDQEEALVMSGALAVLRQLCAMERAVWQRFAGIEGLERQLGRPVRRLPAELLQIAPTWFQRQHGAARGRGHASPAVSSGVTIDVDWHTLEMSYQVEEAHLDHSACVASLMRTHQLSYWLPVALPQARRASCLELHQDVLAAEGIEPRLHTLLRALGEYQRQLRAELDVARALHPDGSGRGDN